MFLTKSLFAKRLLGWYDKVRRDLPWRVPAGAAPNPYHIFVSETMLQQTQVRQVLPYFDRFIRNWPTLSDLAAADEQAVLKAWQGLGYYSRARNLLAAVRIINQQHGGNIPADVATLLELPGVGRYTAGAVASIAHNTSAPIVDGNVARVLCRLDKIAADPRERPIQQLLWRRAEEILPKKRVGDFNSALMELGATVCTPRSPQCLICPVQKHCEAFAAGLQDKIPLPKKSKPIPSFERATLCVSRGVNGQTEWLLEQRPLRGRWAGLWQFITIEPNGRPVTSSTVRAATGVKSAPPRRIGTIQHALTHRRYEFNVYLCESTDAGSRAVDLNKAVESQPMPRRWVRLDDLHAYPLPRPHALVAQMLETPAHGAA